MPAIHVIFDPLDNVSPPPPEITRSKRINMVMLRVDGEITPERVDVLAKAAATMLLNQIALDGQ